MPTFVLSKAASTMKNKQHYEENKDSRKTIATKRSNQRMEESALAAPSALLPTKGPSIRKSTQAFELQQVVGNLATQRQLAGHQHQGLMLEVQREEAGAAKAGTAPEATPKDKPAVKHYSLKTSDISLSSEVETKIGEIADAYYEKTKKDIVVTDGTRTAADQADRMFTKLKLGDDIVALYGNKEAAKSIKKAYDDGVKAKKSDSDIKSSMTEVIEEQIKKGIYISNHLEAGAVDIRKTDMTDAEKKTFKEVAESKGVSVLEENTPPHLHLKVK